MPHDQDAANKKLVREMANIAGLKVVEPIPEVRGWPKPIQASEFYGPAGDFVKLLEPQTEADPAALYLQMLAVAGNILGREAYCRVRETLHYSNLFVGNVGPTAGGRKGLGADSVTHVGQMIDSEWFQKCIVSGTSSGEFLIERVKDSEEAPTRKALAPDDPFYNHPEPQERRLMVFEDELAFLLNSARRESSTSSSVLRNAWDGKRLQVGAKNTGAVATNAHISLIGHITREELMALLTDTMIKGGLVNRFLWICSRRTKLLPEGGDPVNFWPIAKRLELAKVSTKGLGLVRRDDEAKKLWDPMYKDVESATRNGMFGKATCRSSAQMLRLSLIFCLLDGETVIRCPHIEAARAVWRYSEDSARFIFDDFTGDENADKILAELRLHPMTRTEISKDIFGSHLTQVQLSVVLESLFKSGKARREMRLTGGRSTEIWSATE